MPVSLVKANATYAVFMMSPKLRTMRQFAIAGQEDCAYMLAHSTTPHRLRFIRMV